MEQQLNKNGMYNVSFTLGGCEDYSVCETYRLECNYPVAKLIDAYKKAIQILGFDFTEVANEDRGLQNEELEISLKYNLIDEKDVDQPHTEEAYYYFENTDDYVDYMFKCLSIVLPDLKYNYRELDDFWFYAFENSGEALLNETY